MVSSDDEDAYGNALGLYRTYLGSLVQPVAAIDDDDAAAALHHHGTQSPLSEDEQSVRSEDVQLYGQFMRSLITNEDEVAAEARTMRKKNVQRLHNTGARNDGDDDNDEQNDAIIGKTVLAESPSSKTNSDDKLERDEWLARSLSAKMTIENDQALEQEVLVRDAKNFLAPRGITAATSPKKKTRSHFVGDATKNVTTNSGSVLVIEANGRTTKASTDPWLLSTATKANVTPVVKPQVGRGGGGGGGTPDTKSTTPTRDDEADQDTETGETTRMYAVPWSLGSSKPKSYGRASVMPKKVDSRSLEDGSAVVAAAQSNKQSNKWLSRPAWSLGQGAMPQSLDDDQELPSSERRKSRFCMFRLTSPSDGEVPGSEKPPKSRFWKCLACVLAFFSTPLRCATAFMMACHFVSAIVSLASFTHRLQCCDEVVDLKSHAVFRIVSTVYFLWVLIQIPPVVVKGQVRFWTIPNPYFGYVLASTLALHSFFWRAVSAFVLESTALTLQLVMVHLKDFKWRWVRLVVTLMPVILCLAHVFLVFVNDAGQCVVHTKEGWLRTGDDACIVCSGDDRPLILDKYRDPCVRPSTRYSSDIWGEHGDYCGTETNTFCFYSYAG